MPGIDTDRVVHGEHLEDELRELICVFCDDLVDPNDAVQTPCGHVFCLGCILKAIDALGPTCPIDKTDVLKEHLTPLKEANRIVYRMLGRTVVRCENFSEGCNWRGELSEVSTHLQSCTKTPIHCKCCQDNAADLTRAKELITGFERLVTGYETKVARLEQQLTQYKQALAKEKQKAGDASPMPLPAEIVERDLEPSGVSVNYPPVSTSVEPGPLRASSSSVPQELQLTRETSQIGSSKATLSHATHTQPWRGGIFVATLLGHTDAVNSMVVSSDGTLYSGSWDGSIKVWQGQVCVATLTGHKSSVNKLLIGPDGTLYSCGDDKTIRAWQDLQCVAILEKGGNFASNPVTLATAGDALFVGYYKGGVSVFEGFKKVATIREHNKGSSYLDLVASRDGAIYLSGNVDKTILVYKGGAVVATLSGHTGDVYSMVVGNDGTLYSLATDDTIRIWRKNVCVGVISGSGAGGELLLGQDGVLYCGHLTEPVVRVWRGKECVATLQGHQAVVVTLIQAPDATLYSGDKDGVIKVWRGTG